MKVDEVHELLASQFVSTLSVNASRDGYKAILPFNDYLGDPIEVFLAFTDGQVVVDDLGRSAGVLFSTGQHSSESPAHHLMRNLSDAYKINMDYNTGLLSQEIKFNEIRNRINDFIKVLISIQTVVPELQRRRRGPTGRTRLSSLIGRDIQQLKLPVHVQRQVEVEGRRDSWLVDYKYARKMGAKYEDVLIFTTELNIKEPRKQAEHALALAIDILAIEDSRKLKVVYSLNGNGESSSTYRAAMLIDDSQGLVGYKAYNYADLEHRSQLMASTIQDLTPLSEPED